MRGEKDGRTCRRPPRGKTEPKLLAPRREGGLLRRTARITLITATDRLVHRSGPSRRSSRGGKKEKRTLICRRVLKRRKNRKLHAEETWPGKEGKKRWSGDRRSEKDVCFRPGGRKEGESARLHAGSRKRKKTQPARSICV